MEPRLNIKIADLWQEMGDNAPNPVDVDFENPKQQPQWEGDYISVVDDADRNWADKQSLRDDWAQEIDRDNSIKQNTDAATATNNPGSQGPWNMANDVKQGSKINKQASGFRNQQARENFTFGVIANVNSGTLVNGRVYAETPTTKIAGTVIAVGDQEFAVIWDDKTASVERKSDYELVVKN